MDTDELRALRPDHIAMSAERRASARATVLATLAEAEPHRSGARTRPVGRTRTVVVGSVLAAAAVLGAAAAAATVRFAQPDPSDVATVLSDAGASIDVHGEGWRPELDAERVVCAEVVDGSLSITAFTQASGFPLGESMEEELIAQECVAGVDEPPADAGVRPATVCVYEELVRPVVLVDGGSCDQVALVGVTADHLAALNARRAAEVAILAVVADGGCPTAAEAGAWVTSELERSPEDLRLVGLVDDEPSSCYRPTVDWDTRTVSIVGSGLRPAPG